MRDEEQEDAEFDLSAAFEALENEILGPALAELDTSAAARLFAHVAATCGENSVTIHLEAMNVADAFGDLKTREIHVPEVRSELAYLVAMHEIGHVVLGLPSHTRTEDGVEERLFGNEATVWEWAIENALDPVTDNAARAIRHLISSDDPGDGLGTARARIDAAVVRRRSNSN